MTGCDATVLVIGYGNPGRLDDGLGPAVAGAVGELALPGVTVDADYQLTVEDAAAVAAHDVVVFADAAAEGAEPFFFRAIEPEAAGGFTTHSVEPAAVLAMAHDLFGARTRGYVLGVRGYAFNEFGEQLSGRARANLTAAVRFLGRVLRSRRFDEALTEPDRPAAAAAAPTTGDEP